MPQDNTTAVSKSRAAQFKANRLGEPLALPSGAEIMVRRVPLLTMLRHTDIPHPIQIIVNKMIADTDKAKRGGANTDTTAIQDRYKTQITAAIMEDPIDTMSQVGGVTLMLCSVDPQFVKGEAQTDDQVSLDDVEIADKIFVFNWLAGTTMDVSSFRGFPAQALAAAPDGEGLRPAT